MRLFAFVFCVLFVIFSQAQVYKVAEYVYSVQVFDKNGKEVNVTFNGNNCRNIDENWDLIPKDSINDKVISFYSMEFFDGVVNGGQKAYFIKYYNSKKQKLSESVTGLIESKSKIWMHPPRNKFFKILQLNPFPEIRSDVDEWNTELKVGSHWGNKRWKTWDGNITVKSNYKRVGDKVTAVATSEVGTSKLTSTFDENKGFTLFEYENIDGSRVVFKLVEIIE